MEESFQGHGPWTIKKLVGSSAESLWNGGHRNVVLTPFDHSFIVILHGPLRFRRESGSGCARSWSGALGTILRTKRVGHVLFGPGHASKLSSSALFVFFSDIFFCTDTWRFVGVNFVPSMSQIVILKFSNNALYADHVVLFYLLCDDDPHLLNNEQKTS